jgi:hypothetical protein
MSKILVSIPDTLTNRMKAVIPPRQRSKILSKLLEEEVRRREAELFKCASEVEKDRALSSEMQDWDITIGDGIDDET